MNHPKGCLDAEQRNPRHSWRGGCQIEQIAKAKAMREARARAPAKPEFKIGSADNGRRDRKRADVKLKRFD
jgi:hypothetical protein